MGKHITSSSAVREKEGRKGKKGLGLREIKETPFFPSSSDALSPHRSIPLCFRPSVIDYLSAQSPTWLSNETKVIERGGRPILGAFCFTLRPSTQSE